MNFVLKICKLSGTEWKQYNSLQKCRCEKCKALIPVRVFEKRKFNNDIRLKKVYSKPRRVSLKQQKLNLQYSADRIIFLSKPENKICPVTGQPTTEVHHVRKRRGYADEWARLNNIPLLLDQRFWLAVSRDGHDKIENNPTWAYEMGYSQKNNSKN